MEILIAGIGAIGSNLAAILTADLRGEHKISILDRDFVEKRNYQAGTQFYMPEQEGMLKVHALQYNIYKWYQREVNAIDRELDETTADQFVLAFHGGLIVDCFDNHDSRKLLQETCRKRYINCLHAGFSDQFTFAVEWAENYQVPTDITTGMDICEMQGAAAFVKTVAGLTASVVEKFLETKDKIEIIGNRFSSHEIH